MKIINCPQQSPEWFRARLAIPTASNFHKILTPKKLELASGRKDYAHQLLAEWLLGIPLDNFESPAVERGRELEPQARKWYSITRGVDVQQVGFILRDDERVGCSPDGLVGDDGGLELKCPLEKQMVAYLLDDKVDQDHLLQIQGSLWITGRKWWDVLAWHPDIEPSLVRVLPDPKVFAALDQCVTIFLNELTDAKQHLIERGAIPTGTAVA